MNSRILTIQTVTLKTLFDDRELLNKFVKCYREIFDQNESGEFLAPGETLQWQMENWREEDVLEMLNKHLQEDTEHGENTLLSLMMDAKGEVVGFLYGSIVDGVENLTDFPKSYSGISSLEVDADEIKELVRQKYPDAKKFISMREMGIRGDIRAISVGLGGIFELVTPFFMESLERGASHFVFWTSKNSNLYRIATGSVFDLIRDFQDEEKHVYMGANLVELMKRMMVGPDVFKKTMK